MFKRQPKQNPDASVANDSDVMPTRRGFLARFKNWSPSKKILATLAVITIISIGWVWLQQNLNTVAVVDGHKITKSQYNDLRPRLEKFYRYSEDEESLKDLKGSIINYLVEDKVVQLEAAKRNLRADETEVQKRYDALVASYQSEAAYLASVEAAYGWTADLTKRTIRRELLIEQLQPQLLSYRAGKAIIVQHLPGGDLQGEPLEAYKGRASAAMTRVKADVDGRGFDQVYGVATSYGTGANVVNPIFVVANPYRWAPQEAGIDRPALDAVYAALPNSLTEVVETETFFGLFKLEQIGTGQHATWEEFINSYPKKIYHQRLANTLSSTWATVTSLLKIESVYANHANCNGDGCHAGRVRGSIRDQSTGEGIANAEVYIHNEGNKVSCQDQHVAGCVCGPKNKTATTGGGGFYNFERIDGPGCFLNCWYGGWRVRVTKAGYHSYNDFFNPINGATVDLDIRLRPNPAVLIVEARRTDNENRQTIYMGETGGNVATGNTPYQFDRAQGVDGWVRAPQNPRADNGDPLVFDRWANCNRGSDEANGRRCNVVVNQGNVQTITAYYRPSGPPPQIVDCQPNQRQTIQIGRTASFTAQGGNGSYSWSAPGGNPSNGASANFSANYNSQGNYTVTVTSGNNSDSCEVSVVSGNVIPVVCSPSNQQVQPNQGASITASNGSNYSWSVSPSDNMSMSTSSDGSQVTLIFTSQGTKLITVSGGNGTTATCQITVTSSPPPPGQQPGPQPQPGPQGGQSDERLDFDQNERPPVY